MFTFCTAVSALLAVLIASSVSASALPGSDASLSSRVSAAVASASLVPYKKPSEPVKQILAIGDSYSAGIGSNGLPDYLKDSYDCRRYAKAYPLQLKNDAAWGDSKPDIVFGACSGEQMQQLINNQLKQGDPNPRMEYTAIGKPQVAIMTISGNDVDFSKAINDCVIWGLLVQDCDTTLTNIENKINSVVFEGHLIDTFLNIIGAGRQAKGANPPESFQVYIAGYVQFWNDRDVGCNDVTFNFWPWYSNPKLTTDLRHRMNILVDKLNSKISEVASYLSDYGVVYVDGFQAAYDTHRFCEPAPKDYLSKPIGKQTWFWHFKSNDWPTGGEDGYSTDSGSKSLPQQILDLLIPDKAQQATLSASNPPWNVNPSAFKDEPSFYAAIDRAVGDNGTADILLSERVKRIFHPKGTAYEPYAKAFMNSIRANRDLAAPPPSPPSKAPYANGVCSFHLTEDEAPCVSHKDDISASIVLKDNSGAEIGNTHGYTAINAKDPLSLDSKLPVPIVVTGEHRGDYVQFAYGNISWTNKEPMVVGGTTVAHCNNGGWNPRGGAVCGRVSQMAQRNMDCFFVC